MADRQEYQSTHTGQEIDAAVDRATLVVANPNDTAEETLTKINIANTIYELAASGGMNNPMTTVGDIIIGGNSGTPERLGIGSNGQVLTSNGTTMSWQTPSGGGGSVEGLPLGFIFSSALPQTNLNYHLLNGDSLAIADYGDFYTLLTTLVGQSWNLTCTANEYAEDIVKTGNCGKFVINNTSSDVSGTYDTTTITVTANSFKLPTITRFIQGLSSLSNLGESVEAGLPNITGTFGIRSGTGLQRENDSYYSGAFYKGNGTGNVPATENGTAYNYGFDASLSSSVYGNANTVQPQATYYPYYMVVKNNNATGVMNYLQELAQAGVQSIGGAVGDITLGNRLKVINNELSVVDELYAAYEFPTIGSSVRFQICDAGDFDKYIYKFVISTSTVPTNKVIYLRFGDSQNDYDETSAGLCKYGVERNSQTGTISPFGYYAENTYEFNYSYSRNGEINIICDVVNNKLETDGTNYVYMLGQSGRAFQSGNYNNMLWRKILESNINNISYVHIYGQADFSGTYKGHFYVYRRKI